MCEHTRCNCDHKFIAGFKIDQVLSYTENKAWFIEQNFLLEELDDIEFEAWIKNVVSIAISTTQESISILVDVSSQTRYRLALIVDAIASSGCSKCIEVDFLYAIAKFTPPPDSPSTILTAGPVLDRFAGWSTEPELPIAVVVGAGYETDKVIGLIEYLETDLVWVWIPKGKDIRFLEALQKANKSLWEVIPVDRRIHYDLLDPYTTFIHLESLCYGLSRKTRSVVVPFGPKIFALISMLVALHWSDELSIWRVSGEAGDTPIDREAEGAIVGLSATFCETKSD